MKYYPEDYEYLSSVFKRCGISYISKGAYAHIYGICRGRRSKMSVIKIDNIDIPKHSAVKIFQPDGAGMPYSMLIELCNTISHDNVIKFIGMTYKTGKYGLLMQRHMGTLRDIFGMSLKRKERYLHKIIHSMLKVLYVAKINKVIHRDIKATNILIDLKENKLTTYLTDFGLAVRNVYGGEWTKGTTNVYTMWYRPPEIVSYGEKNSCHYDEKADIWALGCTIYEYITKIPLIKAYGLEEYIRRIRKLTGDKNPTYNNNDVNIIEPVHEIDIEGLIKKHGCLSETVSRYVPLLKRMLAIDPKKRISVEEALKYPMFDDKVMCVNEFVRGYQPKFFCSVNIHTYIKQNMIKKVLKYGLQAKFLIETCIIGIDVFDRYARDHAIGETELMKYLGICVGIAFKYNEQYDFDEENMGIDGLDSVSYDEIEMKILEHISYQVHNQRLCVVLRALLFTPHSKGRQLILYRNLIPRLPALYTLLPSYTAIANKISSILKENLIKSI